MNMWFSARLYQQAIFHSNACGVPYYCTRRAILQSNRAPHYISRRAPSSNHTGAIPPTRGAPYYFARRVPFYYKQGAVCFMLADAILLYALCHILCTRGAILLHAGRHTPSTQGVILLHAGKNYIARGGLYYCTGSATCYMRTGCHASNKQNKSTLYTFLSTTVKLKFKY